MSNPLRVGVIGYGYWGPNLVRNFTACRATKVVAVADKDPARRAAVAAAYPSIGTVDSDDAIMNDADIDAVALATPLHTHFPLARAALAAGKHVLVEKPLAGSVAECDELIELAKSKGLSLMVDHTFIYTGAVEKVRELVDDGTLGDILYFDSVRINLGLFQPDFNVIWDLAPHDLSIIDHTLRAEPKWVQAIGATHYQGQHANLAYMTIGFAGELLAHLHVNWVAPVKTRKITIAGTKRMLVYDDTNPAERVKVYEKGVDVDPADRERLHRLKVQYRTGDIHVPELSPKEALRGVVEEFAASVTEKRAALTDGVAGRRVVQLLAAAQASVEQGGKRIEL